ncbi:MAG TPA: histidine phosphatase family protein [Planctomycetota bacterium]|nr:histidine phosphatase family protein [Planctomycetota bacterium]
MRRLVLVRHGETEGRSSVHFLGRTDTALAEEGREQIRRVRDALAETEFDAAFTSPLARARESARILLEGRGVPLRVVEDFREIDFGRLEGLTEPQIAEREPEFYRLWRLERSAEGYPGGEAFEGFRSRVVGAFDRLEEEGAFRGSALLVAHRGTVRAILARLLGPETWPRRDLLLDLGGWVALREEEAGWRLARVPPG